MTEGIYRGLVIFFLAAIAWTQARTLLVVGVEAGIVQVAGLVGMLFGLVEALLAAVKSRQPH